MKYIKFWIVKCKDGKYRKAIIHSSYPIYYHKGEIYNEKPQKDRKDFTSH